MSGMISIKISDYSESITGLVLFIRKVQSLVLCIDWICRDLTDVVARSLAGFLHNLQVGIMDVSYE